MSGRAWLSDGAIRELTNVQREMLIAHVDGEVPIIVAKHNPVRAALLARGLLRTTQHKPPRATMLTDQGRRALGIILGDYADALVRAGMLEQSGPINALLQLKAMRAMLPKEPPVQAESAGELRTADRGLAAPLG